MIYGVNDEEDKMKNETREIEGAIQVLRDKGYEVDVDMVGKKFCISVPTVDEDKDDEKYSKTVYGGGE